ncbi:hypothetical protein J4481_01380 [Candidatus Pacearchaeota archaeon]|nr:hypothetical protein [Candidatus Pacearchaeota archaeon]
MAWFDKLKALFNFELNSPLISVNVTKNSDNAFQDREFVLDENKGQLIINYDKLNLDKKQKLRQIFRDKVEGGGEIFEINSFKLLSELYNYQKSKGEDKKILDFFSSLIPKEDLEALESSLFLRRKFNEKKDIRKLKEDIRRRFGDRGNNIANLCTAGYFEKFLIPLFNSSKEDFERIYEVVISKLVLVIFCS